MSLVADISVPPEAILLGRVFETHPKSTVEFEAVVPLAARTQYLVWISVADPPLDVERLSDHGDLLKLRRLDTRSEGALCRVHVESGVATVGVALTESRAHLLAGRGTNGGWRFRFLCADRREFSDLSDRITEMGFPVTIERIRRHGDGESSRLSSKQHSAVRQAFESGYFEIPRRVTIQDLADEIGISDAAFSQRLRRGLQATINDSFSAGILGRPSH